MLVRIIIKKKKIADKSLEILESGTEKPSEIEAYIPFVFL